MAAEFWSAGSAQQNWPACFSSVVFPSWSLRLRTALWGLFDTIPLSVCLSAVELIPLSYLCFSSTSSKCQIPGSFSHSRENNHQTPAGPSVVSVKLSLCAAHIFNGRILLISSALSRVSVPSGFVLLLFGPFQSAVSRMDERGVGQPTQCIPLSNIWQTKTNKTTFLRSFCSGDG